MHAGHLLPDPARRTARGSRRRWRPLVLLPALALVLSSCAFVARSSESTDATQGDNSSISPSVSDDGRFVAFASTASNLVPGDTNGTTDVFVRDHAAKVTERVSVADGTGAQVGGPNFEPSISDDGRYVAFTSFASDLVSGDANPLPDVFVHDRQTGATTLASIDLYGDQLVDGAAGQPDISGDGRYVAFRFDPIQSQYASQVYRHDLQTGETLIMSTEVYLDLGFPPEYGILAGSEDSRNPAISDDGSLVVFETLAALVTDETPGDPAPDENGTWDVYVSADRSDVWELPVGVATAVSIDDGVFGNGGSFDPDVVGTDGVAGPEGTVVFETLATNLTGSILDFNGEKDVVRADLASRQVAAVDASGIQMPNDASSDPTISDDGRWVAFRSAATDLVGGDTNGVDDVFVRDLEKVRTIRASTDLLLDQANDDSSSAEIAGGGRYVVYTSDGTDIVAPDGNDRPDVFLRHVVSPRIDDVSPSTAPAGTLTNLTVTGADFDEGAVSVSSDASGLAFGVPAVSADGTELAVSVFVPGDTAPDDYDLRVTLLGTGPGGLAGALDLCTDCLVVP